MDYKEWTEKEKKKVIEERKKLESIEAEKINMESKSKKQKSSTGEKIAKAIMIFSSVIIIAALITVIAYGGAKSAPLLAKIVIYAGCITMLAWVVFNIILYMFSEYKDEEELEDDLLDWYLIYYVGKKKDD